MKIFISADIEGVAGIANWVEARDKESDYIYFADQMSKEVAAASEGANNAGAKEIVIKDAHATGRNINARLLPENTKLIRGWSGHPFRMVQELDETFDALMFVGYHTFGGSNGNPLAHTLNSSKIDYIKLNNEFCSEYLLHSYVAAYLGVPVVFLSGDQQICEEAKKWNENIVTVQTNMGHGSSSIGIHPDKSIKLIKEAVEKALKDDLQNKQMQLPEKFILEIKYNYHGDAYRNSFYPGVEQIEPKTITFESKDYFDIMTAISFLI